MVDHRATFYRTEVHLGKSQSLTTKTCILVYLSRDLSPPSHLLRYSWVITVIKSILWEDKGVWHYSSIEATGNDLPVKVANNEVFLFCFFYCFCGHPPLDPLATLVWCTPLDGPSACIIYQRSDSIWWDVASLWSPGSLGSGFYHPIPFHRLSVHTPMTAHSTLEADPQGLTFSLQ